MSFACLQAWFQCVVATYSSQAEQVTRKREIDWLFRLNQFQLFLFYSTPTYSPSTSIQNDHESLKQYTLCPGYWDANVRKYRNISVFKYCWLSDNTTIVLDLINIPELGDTAKIQILQFFPIQEHSII